MAKNPPRSTERTQMASRPPVLNAPKAFAKSLVPTQHTTCNSHPQFPLSQCLVGIISNIAALSRFIMAQHPKHSGAEDRPYETILPLSQDLGLKPDTKIKRDDESHAAKTALGYEGPGNVLVCWEHGCLALIAAAIGVKVSLPYEGRVKLLQKRCDEWEEAPKDLLANRMYRRIMEMGFRRL
jgi:hypothetical protein